MTIEYENIGIDMMFPPPPCPPFLPDRELSNYKKKLACWNEGLKDWKKRREENVINNRFEILDL